MTAQLQLPFTDADATMSRMNLDIDCQNVQVDFNVPSSYTYASMLPKEAQTLMSAPRLGIKVNIATHNIADSTNNDVYDIDLSVPLLRRNLISVY